MTARRNLSLLFACMGIVCLMLAFGMATSINAYRLFNTGKYVQARTSVRLALPVAQLANVTTFHSSATMQTWESGLRTLVAANNSLVTLQALQKQVSDGGAPNITLLVENAQQLEVNLQDTVTNIGSSPLLSRMLRTQLSQLEKLHEVLSHTVSLASQFTEGQKTLLILLQNSDELRATGGFMGSYVLVKFDSGNVEELVVEDIYDADGQVREYFEPPSGVKNYLTGGNGWRLPDANWHPDFAQSAQDTLRFFALAERSHIDGVVAINLPMMQSLLSVTGPLTLLDQDLVLSEANVSQVLRADRAVFFAGSTAKKSVLLQAITQLKLVIAKLDMQQKKQLVEQLRQHLARGNILAYFPNPNLELAAVSLGLAGPLGPPSLRSDTLFYYPLESNVGINKVNAVVTREFVMTTAPTLTELGITLHNSSTQDGYVNYQRLLFNPEQSLKEIVVNGEQVTEFDSAVITSSTGQKYQQVGFLVTILPSNTTRITMTLTHPAGFSTIVLQKQPGTANTTLTSITSQGMQAYQLTQSFLEYMIE